MDDVNWDTVTITINGYSVSGYTALGILTVVVIAILAIVVGVVWLIAYPTRRRD